MAWFWIGVGFGVLLTVPLAAIAAKKQAARTRALTQRARSASHLAELGTMTAGLAHEIKNPLSTVGLNAQLIQEDLHDLAELVTDNDRATDQIGRIERRFDTLTRETLRLREILEDFLQFAGRVKLDLAPTDVNEMVDELVDFFGPQAEAAGVNLRTKLSARPGTARIDRRLVKQAVLNLMINATQAMQSAREAPEPDGGSNELILRTELRRPLGQDEIAIHVIDTGPGIAPDTLQKILTPYFSTKKRGTGLGLPTAKRIVEEHGGTLTVHSEPGRGSDFVISLPVESAEKPAPSTDTPT